MATVRRQTVRLDQDGPLSIPTEIREAARLDEGETVLVEVGDGGIVIRQIDADQAGFWTSEWLEGERDIDAEAARGATPAVYPTTAAFLAHLDGVSAADDAA
jgi:AbrB family looped-hinge helix DNA binding protein